METYAGQERRQYPRIPWGLVELQKGQDMPAVQCPAENLSAGGVCVRLDEELQLLSRVSLKIMLNEESSPIECQGKVNWTMGLAQKEVRQPFMYNIGIEFTTISDEDKERVLTVVRQLSSMRSM